jgi:asparagine synthase (glutamine-hydrolysing)
MNKCKKFLYRESFINDIRGYDPFSPTRELMDKTIGLSHLAKMLYIDTKTWLPDDLLMKADKMTMATSVELRVPLLDSSVLEFAASLPDNYKVGILGTKRILKRVLSEAVPREILNRRKTGFPVPYSRWIRSDLYELVQEILLPGQPLICKYFEKAAIERLVRGLREADYSREIFCLLVLEILHRAFSLD